jgi:hypothetical protein
VKRPSTWPCTPEWPASSLHPNRINHECFRRLQACQSVVGWLL